MGATFVAAVLVQRKALLRNHTQELAASRANTAAVRLSWQALHFMWTHTDLSKTLPTRLF